MSLIEVILWIVLIPITEFFVLIVYDWWKDRKKPDLRCDICEQIIHPRFIKKTIDKKYWACTKCRKIYAADQKARNQNPEE